MGSKCLFQLFVYYYITYFCPFADNLLLARAPIFFRRNASGRVKSLRELLHKYCGAGDWADTRKLLCRCHFLATILVARWRWPGPGLTRTAGRGDTDTLSLLPTHIYTYLLISTHIYTYLIMSTFIYLYLSTFIYTISNHDAS